MVGQALSFGSAFIFVNNSLSIGQKVSLKLQEYLS